MPRFRVGQAVLFRGGYGRPTEHQGVISDIFPAEKLSRVTVYTVRDEHGRYLGAFTGRELVAKKEPSD